MSDMPKTQNLSKFDNFVIYIDKPSICIDSQK